MNQEKKLLVWVGRFRSFTGYGKATRDYFYSLKSALSGSKDFDICGIDAGSGKLIDPYSYISLTSTENGMQYAFSDYQSVHIICHETADFWRRVEIAGRTRLYGLTVHEFDCQAVTQKDPLTLANEIWVPSTWNKSLLVEHLRLAEDYVFVAPHVITTGGSNDSGSFGDEVNSVLKTSKFTFLMIVSNLERKNVRNVITSFIEEFSELKDQVRLIVKLPAKITEEQMRRMIVPAEFSWCKVGLPEVLIIKSQLSDSEISYLQSSSDCLVNCETSKGFDLDTANFLVRGKQVMATYVGGVTEYASPDQVYCIPQTEVEFFNTSNFTNEKLYGNVVSLTPSIASIRVCFRKVFQDYNNRIVRNTPEHAKRTREILSSFSISKLILERVSRYTQSEHFASLHDPVLTLHNAPYERTTFPFQQLSLQEIEKLNSELKKPGAFSSRDEWLADRRKTFGKLGGLPPIQAELQRLAGLRGSYSGKRCFVIGNGPSLNKTRLDLLKNEFTFCSNKFYLKVPELEWTPSFYTCLDWRVTPDDADNLQEAFDRFGQTIKFLPNRFKHLFKPDKNTFWYFSIPAGRYLSEKFEIDATKGVRGGGTVSTAMIQLAAFLGFSEIYLIGTDVSYQVPASVIQEGKDKFNTGVKINLTSTKDDDPNHFCSNYFGAGARWHDPNVPEMIRGFRNCYLAANMHGVKLINATVGGNLNCIPRVSFDSLF